MRSEQVDEISVAELTAWLRFAHLGKMREALDAALGTDRDREIYSLSDGQRTAAEIGRQCGITRQAVSQKWGKWRALGLAFEVPSVGTTKHLLGPEVY